MKLPSVILFIIIPFSSVDAQRLKLIAKPSNSDSIFQIYTNMYLDVDTPTFLQCSELKERRSINFTLKNNFTFDCDNSKLQEVFFQTDDNTIDTIAFRRSSIVRKLSIRSYPYSDNRIRVDISSSKVDSILMNDVEFIKIFDAEIGLLSITQLNNHRHIFLQFDAVRLNNVADIICDSVVLHNVIFQRDSKLVISPLHKNVSLNLLNYQNIKDRFEFDYSLVNLSVPDYCKARILKDVIQMQTKNNYGSGKQKADIELQEYDAEKGNVLQRLSISVKHYWNYYGYHNELIFIWTIGLFLIFWLVNLLSFDTLFQKVYPIAALEKYFETRSRLKSTVSASLFFTVVVFFGLKIELATLKLDKKAWVIYFYLQYIVGIICLAYLINFVIKQ